MGGIAKIFQKGLSAEERAALQARDLARQMK
jgi:hypothetical protein